MAAPPAALSHGGPVAMEESQNVCPSFLKTVSATKLYGSTESNNASTDHLEKLNADLREHLFEPIVRALVWGRFSGGIEEAIFRSRTDMYKENLAALKDVTHKIALEALLTKGLNEEQLLKAFSLKNLIKAYFTNKEKTWNGFDLKNRYSRTIRESFIKEGENKLEEAEKQIQGTLLPSTIEKANQQFREDVRQELYKMFKDSKPLHKNWKATSKKLTKQKVKLQEEEEKMQKLMKDERGSGAVLYGSLSANLKKADAYEESLSSNFGIYQNEETKEMVKDFLESARQLLKDSSISKGEKVEIIEGYKKITPKSS